MRLRYGILFLTLSVLLLCAGDGYAASISKKDYQNECKFLFVSVKLSRYQYPSFMDAKSMSGSSIEDIDHTQKYYYNVLAKQGSKGAGMKLTFKKGDKQCNIKVKQNYCFLKGGKIDIQSSGQCTVDVEFKQQGAYSSRCGFVVLGLDF